MHFTIKTMQPQHIPAIMEIEQVAYEFPWSETLFSDCLKVGYPGWVAWKEEEMVGYVLMSSAVDQAHVLNLCTAAAHRREGIGEALLRTCIEYSETLNAATIYLEARVSNPGAIRLYERLGFQRIGLRTNYYPATHNTREDAIVLSKSLN